MRRFCEELGPRLRGDERIGLCPRPFAFLPLAAFVWLAFACCTSTSRKARTLGESVPLRHIITVMARSRPGGNRCTLKSCASGNVESTIRGNSEIPIPATTQPSMA